MSYPGAQGGTAILPEPRKGKAQPREYPDVLALLPGAGVRALLNESKGQFSKSALESEVRKLADYKREGTGKRTALARTLVEAERLDQNGKIRRVLIGVSFGGDRGTTWRPGEVDFIFIVPNRKRWRIGVFSAELAGAIRGDYEGAAGLPEVCAVAAKAAGGLFSK